MLSQKRVTQHEERVRKHLEHLGQFLSCRLTQYFVTDIGGYVFEILSDLIVSFVQLTTREDAEAARGTVLSAEPIEDPDALWVHELIGSTVVDAEGVERGVVESVMDNPAAALLVLDSGALVPVAFVVDGPTDGIVRVDVPDGLFDLAE